MEENKNQFTTIETIARLTGTEIECRDLINKWLLITYDIPHTEAGDRARRSFLVTARMIGAARHTDSVYLMPWTPTAEALALEIAKAGKVCVWTSNTTDEKMASEITRNYDSEMQPVLDKIDERLDKIAFHREKNHQKRVASMKDKLEPLLNSIKGAIIRRGSAQLFIMFTLLERRFNQL